MTCPRSYLHGFFLGDGAVNIIKEKYRSYFLCAHPNDISRVNENLLALGGTPEWKRYNQSELAFQFYIPKSLERDIGLDEVAVRSVDRRIPTVSWLCEKSFIEGLWDSDGYLTMGKEVTSLGTRRCRVIGLEMTALSLVSEIASLFKGYGWSPRVDDRQRKTWKPVRSVRLTSTDFEGFKQRFLLQPEKQSRLEEFF